MPMKVAIYTRESGSRQYKPASPRAAYSPNTTFCLRYTQDGKRKWKQLDVKFYKEAQAASLKQLTELITDSCKQKPDVGTVISRNLDLPAPRPAKPFQPNGQLMLDTAIDKYIENVQTKSSKTSGGYRYTLQQFYASSANLVLANITTQQLYDFVGYLRREGLADRTIHNRVGEVVTFLRHAASSTPIAGIATSSATPAITTRPMFWMVRLVNVPARKPGKKPSLWPSVWRIDMTSQELTQLECEARQRQIDQQWAELPYLYAEACREGRASPIHKTKPASSRPELQRYM